jgi:hypothetical protein
MHEHRDVRTFHKATVSEPFLDQRLGFFETEAGYMHIVDQGQVDVTVAPDASLGRKLWDIVDAYFEEIPCPEPQGSL